MSTALVNLVDQYWGQFLGCGNDLVRHAPDPYLLTTIAQPGLWALRCGGRWVVATPEAWHDNVRAHLAACFRPNHLPTLEQLQPFLQTIPATVVYGPAIIFLHQAPDVHRPIEPSIRPLTYNDHRHVTAFAAATDPLPWSLEQMDDWLRIFGYFCGQELVATCGVRLWGDLLAEIYIDTAPAYRRRGYGQAVTAAALHWIQTATPYYVESVVELSNQPSLRLMYSLGFTPYGYLVTVC
ncbi:MAG: N-acetyltransferase [Caldilinea sp. CFX5]|nr:N-acetyltransferase [Caldilinea sp. CFX5]